MDNYRAFWVGDGYRKSFAAATFFCMQLFQMTVIHQQNEQSTYLPLTIRNNRVGKAMKIPMPKPGNMIY